MKKIGSFVISIICFIISIYIYLYYIDGDDIRLRGDQSTFR